MKKIIITIIIIAILSISKGDTIKIPNEALRFRVIANSNNQDDQKIKNVVKQNLEKDIYSYLEKVDSLKEAETTIIDKLDLISNNVSTILTQNDIKYESTISLGMNYFPQKEYKGVTYEEGKYNSLVVTLGSGKGDNWWCVLFPPLCLIEAEKVDSSDIEYKFFIKEILDKYVK